MRIRVIQKPPEPSIDGIRLDLFVLDSEYDVGTTLGMLALADGWAEPVVSEKPALAIPLQELAPESRAPRTPLNLHRLAAQPYFDVAVAADAAPRKHRRGQTRPSPGRSDTHPNKSRRSV